MKNNVTAYKVCRVHDGKFISAASLSYEVVTYEPNKLIKPNKGENKFLFIFKTFADACNYADRYKHPRVILEVKANNIRTQQMGVSASHHVRDYPEGTLFCSSLTLVRNMNGQPL